MIGLISLLKEIEGKPKAIFMAGPAGSGKSFISSKLVPSDFKTINVDDTYEELLKSSGIGMKLAQMSPDELKKAGELMGQARKSTDTKYQDALKNANNLLIDSVGGSSKTLLKKKQELENLGYQTAMIMTYVSPVTSLERNMKRDRSLLPSIVIRSWRDVNKNIDTYKQAFGSDFTLVNLDPEDANKNFDEEYIYQTFIKPLGQVGKEKSPKEIEKSKKETQQIYSDIKQTLNTQPEFDTLEQAQQKITNFINK
jgi:dephospho-CoA kinase